MSKEELLYNVEERVAVGKITNVLELEEYLMDLKNRGLVTMGKIQSSMDELSCFFGKVDTGKKCNNKVVGTRTPKTMEYAYSNVSAGFSSTGMLMLIAISVPALVALVCLINK